MAGGFVVSQVACGPESLLAVVARKGDSFQMVQLNVVYNRLLRSFLSTRFANESSLLLCFPICDPILNHLSYSQHLHILHQHFLLINAEADILTIWQANINTRSDCLRTTHF